MFEYCINREQSPEAFISYLNRRTDSNLFYTLLQENFTTYGLKKNSAGHILSLNSTIGEDEKTLGDTLADPDDGISQLESQIDVDSIQRLSGHTTTNMTRYYNRRISNTCEDEKIRTVLG